MRGLKQLILVIAVAATIGCSKSGTETFQVHGTVTCDGTAVPVGMVTFVPDGPGERVTGSIGPDGSYEVMAPAGRYKVAVVAIEESPSQNVTKENWKEAFAATAPKHYVPQVFGDTETSRLSFIVKSEPENLFDINLSTRRGTRR